MLTFLTATRRHPRAPSAWSSSRRRAFKPSLPAARRRSCRRVRRTCPRRRLAWRPASTRPAPAKPRPQVRLQLHDQTLATFTCTCAGQQCVVCVYVHVHLVYHSAMCALICCAAIRNNDTAAVPATDKAAAADGGRGRKAGKHPPGRSVVDTKLITPVSGTSRCGVIRHANNAGSILIM